jgi:hypothetical protein
MGGLWVSRKDVNRPVWLRFLQQFDKSATYQPSGSGDQY